MRNRIENQAITKIKLEPAAALMMLWVKKAFRSEIMENFLKHLDLSSGEDLYEECSEICDCCEEIFLNRKYFVENLINENLDAQESVLIFLAPGKSPLALEILTNRYEKINRILEIDLEGMEKKKELYDLYYEKYSPKIKCITADIRSPVILSTLNELLNEYFSDIPCTIILEGAFCHYSPQDLDNIVSTFRSDKKNNTFIIEHLLPFESISAKAKQNSSSLLEKIKNSFGLERAASSNPEKIADVFRQNGGRILKTGSLPSIERERIGTNKYFTYKDEDSIDCAAYLI